MPNDSCTVQPLPLPVPDSLVFFSTRIQGRDHPCWLSRILFFWGGWQVPRVYCRDLAEEWIR